MMVLSSVQAEIGFLPQYLVRSIAADEQFHWRKPGRDLQPATQATVRDCASRIKFPVRGFLQRRFVQARSYCRTPEPNMPRILPFHAEALLARTTPTRGAPYREVECLERWV